MKRYSHRLILALLLVAAAAACGGDESVGNEGAMQFDQEQQQQLGASTTAAPSTTTPLGSVTTAPQATTTTAANAPSTTLPPEQQAVTVEVQILDGSPYYQPNYIEVAPGGKVRFVNAGTSAHSIEESHGAFRSGPIAPGGVWIYEATAPGVYEYADPDRPFAAGAQLVVR